MLACLEIREMRREACGDARDVDDVQDADAVTAAACTTKKRGEKREETKGEKRDCPEWRFEQLDLQTRYEPPMARIRMQEMEELMNGGGQDTNALESCTRAAGRVSVPTLPFYIC